MENFNSMLGSLGISSATSGRLLDFWYLSCQDYIEYKWMNISCLILNFFVQVIHQKTKKSLEEIMHDLCPVHFQMRWIIFFTFLLVFIRILKFATISFSNEMDNSLYFLNSFL